MRASRPRSRWPSSVAREGGGETVGGSGPRVALAMVVAPANTPVMTGQTEICITLGEARAWRLASFSAEPR